MAVNVFKLRAALKDIDAAGIDVGDVVRVEWDVAANYGGGVKEHVGVLRLLDRETGWFEVNPSNRTPGHLRTIIYTVRFTKLEGEDEDNARAELEKKSVTTDSKKATKSKKNPFLEKAGKS